MKYYLAGPMSGIPKFNFPAFYAAAEDLRNAGHDIISPAELDDTEHAGEAMASESGVITDSSATWGECLGRDVRIVADECDGIVFLPGWQKSRGARLEAFVGLLCGLKFGVYSPGKWDGSKIDEVSADWVAQEVRQ